MEWLVPARIAQALEAMDFGLPEQDVVPEIPALLNRTVLLGGKRMRPALCLMMGGVFGLDLEKVKPFARAIELTHAASLAHDDVIDEALLRRQRQTLNAAASNVRAVLAGDLLLARVMAEVSRLGPLKVIEDLALAVEDLVRGEWLQDGLRGQVTVDREVLDQVALLKTGSLLRFCAVAPARLAGASESQVQACARLGEAIGVAFQWVDDVLDFDAHSGKRPSQDLQAGLLNSVSVEMLREDPSLVIGLGQILGRERPSFEWPWSVSQLAQAQDRVRSRAADALQDADRLLKEVVGPKSDPECVKSFQQFFVLLANRAT